MSRDQIIADAKAAIVSGQDAVLMSAIGAAVDASALEQKASDGTLGQSDVDAAVAAAVGPLNQQIVDLTAKDEADLAAGQAALVDLQSKMDALASKEAVESGIIEGLQASKDALAKVLSDLAGIGAVVPPPPVPVPVPDPVPVDPAPAA